eukprot:5386430-Pleurochrysis_carterae.AAC.1
MRALASLATVRVLPWQSLEAASAARVEGGGGSVAPRSVPGLLHFGDVAAGPGGFSEYVLWRRGASA